MTPLLSPGEPALLLWRGRVLHLIEGPTRLWTWSKYTHVGWILDGEVVEVVRSGSRVVPLEEYPRGYDVGRFSLGPARQAHLREIILRRRDGPVVAYDWGAMLGHLLRPLPPFCWMRSNPGDLPGRLVCAEAVCADLAEGHHWLPRHPAGMSPGECASLPYVTVYSGLDGQPAEP